jgi:hypothetical protein
MRRGRISSLQTIPHWFGFILFDGAGMFAERIAKARTRTGEGRAGRRAPEPLSLSRPTGRGLESPTRPQTGSDSHRAESRAFDFTRIAISAPERGGETPRPWPTPGPPIPDPRRPDLLNGSRLTSLDRAGHDPSGTRNPDGDSDEDAMTVNGDGDSGTPAFVPAPAPPVTPPSPPPPPGPAAPAQRCEVNSGPSYSPSGTIPVTVIGGRKRAQRFSLAATFTTDAATGKAPSCCWVRQMIKWDTAFHNSSGGPPHSGFPSSTPPNTWIEDRDTADKRYGHRSGPHSDPVAGCGDEYKTGSSQDMANGDTYCGKDSPTGPTAMTGQFQFQLQVIDTCNGDAVKASSSVITINW